MLRAPTAPRRHAAVSMCDPFDMNVLKERIKKQNDGTEQVKMIILDAMVPGQRLALTVTKIRASRSESCPWSPSASKAAARSRWWASTRSGGA